jgi:hypothetical protein
MKMVGTTMTMTDTRMDHSRMMQLLAQPCQGTWRRTPIALPAKGIKK